MSKPAGSRVGCRGRVGWEGVKVQLSLGQLGADATSKGFVVSGVRNSTGPAPLLASGIQGGSGPANLAKHIGAVAGRPRVNGDTRGREIRDQQLMTNRGRLGTPPRGWSGQGRREDELGLLLAAGCHGGRLRCAALLTASGKIQGTRAWRDKKKRGCKKRLLTYRLSSW